MREFEKDLGNTVSRVVVAGLWISAEIAQVGILVGI